MHAHPDADDPAWDGDPDSPHRPAWTFCRRVHLYDVLYSLFWQTVTTLWVVLALAAFFVFVAWNQSS